MEKIPSGEKPTPGRSAPLVLNPTEDHDATSNVPRRRSKDEVKRTPR